MTKQVARWIEPAGEELTREVFARLLAGRPLDGLGLAEHEGRVDLRGIRAPLPSVLDRYERDGWFVERLGPLLTFRDVRLEGLDMSGAQLESLRFFDTLVTGCRFDRARCRDWRLWRCEVTDTSFAGADLRSSALGTGIKYGVNVYRRVDLTHANLSDTSLHEARLEDCDLSHAKISGVDWKPWFVRCRFAGEFRDMVLQRPDGPEDAFVDVDLTEVRFRHVDWRGVDFTDVRLPVDEENLVVEEARCVLDRALQLLGPRHDTLACQVKGRLKHEIAWLGPRQQLLPISLTDVAEYGSDWGELMVAVLADACRQCGARPRGGPFG